MSQESAEAPLLQVDDLSVVFTAGERVVRAVNGVSFTLGPGECLALLGESGSGKSAAALALLGLLDERHATVGATTARFRGRDLLGVDPELQRQMRGRDIAMVFQDAQSALNPVVRVGWQVAEPLRVRAGLRRDEAHRRAVELLDLVGIREPEARARSFPHELSGGMRQRALIAMALALDPEVLIADEPTTALDVTVQAQVLDVLRDVQQRYGMGLLLITHDLGVVAEMADRVAVVYAGRIVESGTTDELLRRPAHPYTRALLASVPARGARRGPLEPVPGSPPDLTSLPSGCAFAPRCRWAVERCRTEVPALEVVEPRGSASAGAGGAVYASRPAAPPAGAHMTACFEHRKVIDAH